MDPYTELALPTPVDGLCDAQVHQLLSEHIARLLVSKRDWLLSKLYRLDVRERDLRRLLASDADAAAGLARLVLDRHYERARTRGEHQPMQEPPRSGVGRHELVRGGFGGPRRAATDSAAGPLPHCVVARARPGPPKPPLTPKPPGRLLFFFFRAFCTSS